jgi:Tfp pilus assembly protein PilF
MADANRAINLDPRLADAYDVRARINEANGKKDGAIADYRRALSINPQLESSLQGLKRLGAKP